MKIENFFSTLDTFTFPYNSLSFDGTLNNNLEIKPIPFNRHHMAISGEGINPNLLVMPGHFSGTSKWTHYRDLAKHFGQSKRLKKLFFESDKFYLGLPRQLKKTHTGGRTNFIDYVFTFETIISILFGSTEKTSGTNGGNANTYLTELQGVVSNGAVDVTLNDALDNQITIPASALSTGDILLYFMVLMVESGSGIYVSEYGWCGLDVESGTTTSTSADQLVQTGQNFLTTVNVGDVVRNSGDSTRAFVEKVVSDTVLNLSDDIMATGEAYTIFHQTLASQTTEGFGLMLIKPGANITTITTTNLNATPTKKFRDGYVD